MTFDSRVIEPGEKVRGLKTYFGPYVLVYLHSKNTDFFALIEDGCGNPLTALEEVEVVNKIAGQHFYICNPHPKHNSPECGCKPCDFMGDLQEMRENFLIEHGHDFKIMRGYADSITLCTGTLTYKV